MRSTSKRLISAMLILAMAFTALFAITASADDVKRDIYLLLDVSGTMTGKHMDRMKADSKQLSESLLNGSNGDNRICIIAFNDNPTVYEFSSDYASVAATIDSLSAGGKSDINKALEAVKTTADCAGRPCAVRHVVVMTDAVMTAGEKSKDGKYKLTDSVLYYQYANKAYDTAEKMWPAYAIHTVGVTLCFGGNEFKFRQRFLKDIANNLFQEEFNHDALLDAILNGQYSPAPEVPTEPASGCPCQPETTTAAPAKEENKGGINLPEIKLPDCDIKGFFSGLVDKAKGLIPGGKSKDEGGNADEGKSNIAQTGSAKTAIAVAAVVMAGAAAFVATKKHEK